MAAKKKLAATAKPGRKAAAKRRGPAEPRGPLPREAALATDDPAVAPLVARVTAAGGVVLAAFRDPYAGRPVLLASLPLRAVEPTPFQRDLSRTHAARLGVAIADSGMFLDPVIAVAGADRFHSPNGRHRLAAAKQLGQRAVTALVVPDEALVYRILPLNTEKAHNLRDRSLEVIRMARSLAGARARSTEADHQAAFEAPYLLTLGAAYEQRSRFAGSSYQPMLRRVDVFLDGTLARSLRQRDQWATRLLDIDDRVTAHIATLQERGFKSPYLRTLVVARCNPVRWIPATRGGGPPMPLGQALQRMAASVRTFDPARVRPGDLALVAAVAADD